MTSGSDSNEDGRECRGPEDAAQRERAIDDSIESVVAALKRVHRVSQMAGALGKDGEPESGRSLVYDLVDVNARYVRNLLSLAARVNDQIGDVFGYSYAAEGRLKEKSVEVKLRSRDSKAVGTFRLHNATSCAVNVDFPAAAEFVKVSDQSKSPPVDLTFSVSIPKGSKTAAASDPAVGVGSSTVLADGILEVTVEISTDWAQKVAWRAEAVIHTNAAHDLDLVLQLEPPG